MSRDPILDRFEKLATPGAKPRRSAVQAPPEDEEKPTWGAKPLVRVLDGREVEFFKLGDLAAALGRRPVTIRSWEASGDLPLSRYRSPPPKGQQLPDKPTMGKRLYTRHQIEVVIDAARRSGVLDRPREADWKMFKTLVLDGWSREP